MALSATCTASVRLPLLPDCRAPVGSVCSVTGIVVVVVVEVDVVVDVDVLVVVLVDVLVEVDAGATVEVVSSTDGPLAAWSLPPVDAHPASVRIVRATPMSRRAGVRRRATVPPSRPNPFIVSQHLFRAPD